MTPWKQSWLRAFLLPAGLVFCVLYSLFETSSINLPTSTLDLYLYAILLVGMVLAWRFHTSRVWGALVLILLAHQAVTFFANGRASNSGPGLTALEAISFLAPLNLLLLAYASERGFTLSSWGPKLVVLFWESVFVAVLCRPQPAPGSALFHGAFLSRMWFTWTRLPQISLLVTAIACVALLLRFVRTRHPVDGAFAWAALAVSMALGSGGVGRMATGMFTTAVLILTISVLESSYRMAYYDELTAIPGRRAFNESLLHLQEPYAIAVVDIDHFKSFNDTFGHETGDEVLRMVAKKLAAVTGGGRAFRVGGEEFSILFAGESTSTAYGHVEALRETIERSQFRLRGSDRRSEPRGAERRHALPSRKGRATGKKIPFSSTADALTITVSIGLAECTPQWPEPRDVIAAGDEALYTAKANGRNRVEIAGAFKKKAKPMRKKRASAGIT